MNGEFSSGSPLHLLVDAKPAATSPQTEDTWLFHPTPRRRGVELACFPAPLPAPHRCTELA